MKEIKYSEKVYALLAPVSEVGELGKTEWFGETWQSLQASRMHYDKKSFKTHKHKINPRTIPKTQEAFVVIRGRVRVTIYEKAAIPTISWSDSAFNANCVYSSATSTVINLGVLEAGPGDIILVWDGFHEIEVIEDDTIAYEIKAGQFTCISDDKEFLS